MIIGTGYVSAKILKHVLWTMVPTNWKCVYGDYWPGVHCTNNIIEATNCTNDVIGAIVPILLEHCTNNIIEAIVPTTS